jgi:N4-gp56 family major capsid protein
MANNTTINSELYANFVTDAEFAAYETSVSRQLCKLFQVPMNAGKVAQVPIWGQLSAQLIADEGAGVAKDTGTEQALITLKEHVYFSQVTDMLRESAYGDVMSQLAEISGRAIGESLDTMAFGEFSNFSSDIGSTSTELTTDLIMKAAATLRTRKIAGPYFAVVHPAAAYYMKKTLTQTLPYNSSNAQQAFGLLNPSNLGNQVLTSGIIGSVGGVTIIESPLVAGVTTGGANAFRAGVFAASALGIAERGGLSMTSLYLPQARSTDLNVVAVAGAGVLQNTHGVAITTEGTI